MGFDRADDGVVRVSACVSDVRFCISFRAFTYRIMEIDVASEPYRTRTGLD